MRAIARLAALQAGRALDRLAGGHRNRPASEEGYGMHACLCACTRVREEDPTHLEPKTAGGSAAGQRRHVRLPPALALGLDGGNVRRRVCGKHCRSQPVPLPWVAGLQRGGAERGGGPVAWRCRFWLAAQAKAAAKTTAERCAHPGLAQPHRAQQVHSTSHSRQAASPHAAAVLCQGQTAAALCMHGGS